MAKYSDADLKWITVHPNGKGEKPGVKVAINGGGEIVKGPKELKDDINASGGLKGAKSVPLEQLKNGGGVDDDVPTFAMPDDFGDLGDDDVPTFSNPDDFGDLSDDGSGDPQKKDLVQEWKDNYLEKFSQWFADDNGFSKDEVKKVVVEMLADNPGLVYEADGLPAVNAITIKTAIIAKLKGLNENGNSNGGVLNLTDEQFNHFADYFFADGFSKDAIKAVLAEKPEMFHVNKVGDVSYAKPVEYNFTHFKEDVLNKMQELGSGKPDGGDGDFTDDEIQQITDILGDHGVDGDDISGFLDAVVNGSGDKGSAEFYFNKIKEELGDDNPLVKKMSSALGMPTEGDAGGGQKPQTPTFTDENIDKFAKDFMKSAGLKGLKNKNIIKKFIAANQDKFSVDPATGEVGVASQEAANELIQHLIDTNPANGGKSSDVGNPPTGNTTSYTPSFYTPPPNNPPKPPWNGDTTGGHKFPASMDEVNGLKFVKNLGGASGAKARLFQDAEGNQYVMKRFEPSDKVGQARLKEECDADTYYLAGGATVPHFKLYGDEKSGYVKLSRFIPGTKQLGEVWHGASPEMKEKIKNGLRQHFALDVMAGAWDVLGTKRDNILVDGEGNVYRCDNGGAFNRRAQGDEKSDAQWGNGHIDDLWTMRGLAAGLDGKKITDGTGKGEFFGDITTHQLLSDIASRDWDTAIAHLQPETKAVMQKRIANAKDYHGMCNNVVVDGKYGDGQHAEDLTLNYHCLNKFGAMAGCKNKNVGPGNWGFCRGNGGGANQKPTLSQFFTKPEPQLSDFTNAPEPQLSSFTKSLPLGEPAKLLKAAGGTINHHCADNTDNTPNMNSVNAALAIKPKLEAVANGTDANAAKAKEMLDYIAKIEDLKAKGFPHLDTKLPFSPSGDVDTDTPEAKANAQSAYDKAHKDWEAKVANAKSMHAQAHSTWENEKAAAEKQLDAAVKAWEQKTGGQGFGFQNLTECFEKFCKDNGIDSKRFWSMAGSQGGSSQSEGSCRLKCLEILAMGGDLNHPFSSVDGVSSHSNSVNYKAKEYVDDPDSLAKDMKAYVAMKAMTQMLLRNSSFVGNFKDRGVVRLCRTENKSDVIDAYGLQKGVAGNYKMGTHESFGVFKTFCYQGHEAVFCDVPYSRISSLYFLRTPTGGNMYLGDGENEAGVNAVGLPKVYWKHVSSGIPLTDAYDFVDKAFGTKSPKVI